jgi:hypothetical protein
MGGGDMQKCLAVLKGTARERAGGQEGRYSLGVAAYGCVEQIDRWADFQCCEQVWAFEVIRTVGRRPSLVIPSRNVRAPLNKKSNYVEMPLSNRDMEWCFASEVP